MRTTGARSVPQPAQRPKHSPDAPDTPDTSDSPPPHDAPHPLPRTKFLIKAASEESPAPAQTPVPSQVSAPATAPATPQSPPAPSGQSKCRTPPPKPPRTPSLSDRTGHQATTPVQPRRPGLMEVLSRPGTAPPAPPVSTATTPQPALRPSRPAPSSSAVPRRTRGPRPQALSLPPPPSTGLPRAPSSSAAPRIPSRPSATELAASRHSAHPADYRPTPPLIVGLQKPASVQSPVHSIEDFEDSCKAVFRNMKTAKELAGRGKHVQAASHYQMTLTAVDRVLRAQVLAITLHELTRQRLFLLQQEVFNVRKEALNGFTDAQTAVRTPRGLSPTNAPPGAPPSYDDVLKEDSRRLPDHRPRPSRQSSAPAAAAASPISPAPVGPGSRGHIRPAPTQPPPTHRPSTRVRCLSGGDSRVEELVDVRGSSRAGEPLTAPAATLRHPSPLRPTLITATRPKSSYHPLTQPDPPLSFPSALTGPASLPPPLLPLSLPPLSLPTSLKPLPCPSPTPALDEAVLSQMRKLQVYEGGQDSSASVSAKEQLPSPNMKDNPQEKKGKEGVTNSGNDMKASGNAMQVKDEAKNNHMASVSRVDDPFLSVDPFPLSQAQAGDKTEAVVFPEESQGGHTSPASTTHHNTSQTFSDDFNPETKQALLTPKMTPDSHSPLSAADNLGDSILEALDVAVTPSSGHKKASPQHSRERRTTRSYSEENLLDSSHNTFEAILLSTRDRQGSRASIIEEFDPLLTSRDHDLDKETKEEAVSEPRESDAWRERSEGVGCAPPKAAPQKAPRSSTYTSDGGTGTRGEEEDYGSPPDYYAEEGAVALEGEDEKERELGNYYTKSSSSSSEGYPGAYCLPEEVKGKTSNVYISSSSSSIHSWTSDYTAKTFPSPTSLYSPVYPSLHPQEEEEAEEVGEEGVDVGRSAFYLPPSTQSETRRRPVLNIREGVKIYFIHTDTVVTSPWKKPVLTVSRDPSKDKLIGSGLVLSVGSSLWQCDLNKKSTLVLQTLAGGYVFSEVAGKPECKAVAIRVPSSVRGAQQDLLSGILQQNTRLEEERPKGITKAISKGATSAATRMSKLVEDQSMTPSNTFVRRNSIRALKGVTKRLATIAEKTGGTLRELPQEYQVLQEAADTLAFALSAKMVQYV